MIFFSLMEILTKKVSCGKKKLLIDKHILILELHKTIYFLSWKKTIN